jgi:hypothetical protein
MSRLLTRPVESFANGPYPERADTQEFPIDRWLRVMAARFFSGF